MSLKPKRARSSTTKLDVHHMVDNKLIAAIFLFKLEIGNILENDWNNTFLNFT